MCEVHECNLYVDYFVHISRLIDDNWKINFVSFSIKIYFVVTQ